MHDHIDQSNIAWNSATKNETLLLIRRCDGVIFSPDQARRHIHGRQVLRHIVANCTLCQGQDSQYPVAVVHDFKTLIHQLINSVARIIKVTATFFLMNSLSSLLGKDDPNAFSYNPLVLQ